MGRRMTVFGDSPVLGGGIIDLRSDVVTRPCERMLEAMMCAEVGNDGWGEDPTVNALQREFADILGKEDAILVPSGSLGNLIAILCHTQRGDEIIVDSKSHVFLYGVAASALVGGVQLRPFVSPSGTLPVGEMEILIRQTGFQYPKTSLICLENTHNIHGGLVISQGEVEAIAEMAHSRGIAMHLDGSRLFNASVATGQPVAELAHPFDSVMCCLSKGLGAPFGSLLAGSSDLISKAQYFRRMLGGHLRQAGYMAAAGRYALQYNVARLQEDHEKARIIAAAIQTTRSLRLLRVPETNIVIFECSPWASAEKVKAYFARNGISVSQYDPPIMRIVTHKDISLGDVSKVCRIVGEVDAVFGS